MFSRTTVWWVMFLFCSFFASSSSAAFKSVRIQIIDRGQADGILIRTPNEKWIVIDAGTNGQQAKSMKDVWGVDKVALAIVSHRHFDHHGGMDEILNTFDVERLIMDMEDCPKRTSDDKVRKARIGRINRHFGSSTTGGLA